VSTTTESPTLSLSQFRNEPAADFSKPENRTAMERALAQVKSELGREYQLLIAGERVSTGDLLKSLNPSRPSEVVGVHHKATSDIARRAVESAHAYFPEWARTPARKRIESLVRAADLIGQMGDPLYTRKANALFFEFEEIGMNRQLGYSSPADIVDQYPRFFWDHVSDHLDEGVGFLNLTDSGRQWIANLHHHILCAEHKHRLMGPQR